MPNQENNDRICIICGLTCNTAQVLTNGKVYHRNCYEKVLHCLDKADSKIAECKREIYNLQQKIRAEETIRAKMSQFFSGHQSKRPVYEKKIKRLQLYLNDVTRKRDRLEVKQKKKLTYIYNYYPTQPPDWEIRRTLILERDNNTCQRCSADNYQSTLHVHHKIPLGRGGHNTIDNLVILCEACHQRAHGVRKFSERESKETYFSQNLKILNKAITEELLVYFHYQKYEGEKSLRTIAPYAFEKIGRSLCVKGFCYLRDENRTFAIRRMTGLKIVDSVVAGFG
ncbi:HNH endonuclease [bacterium]|nr:HNH endonuclease [bacterium]